MNNISYSVLNTIASGAADATLVAGKLVITKDANNSTITPQINYLSIINGNAVTLQPSLVETVLSQTFTWTTGGSANTAYGFVFQQTLSNGSIVSGTINYTTGASTSNTDIGSSLKQVFNAHTEFNATVAYTATNNYITITATAGNGAPLFITGNAFGPGGTLAANMAGVAIASNTTANPTVITSTAHGLVVGSVITIISADETKIVSGTYRVIPTNFTANAYSLASLDEETTLAGTSTTTATVVKRAQYAVGQGADLVAAGITEATSGAIYKTYTFPYDALTQRPERANPSQHTLYVKEGATTTTASYATNFATFDAALVAILQGVDSGGSDKVKQLADIS